MSPIKKRDQRLRGSLPEPRNYALKLLHYRPRSRKEMETRLSRKGFDEKEIGHTLQFLENTGLIEDKTLASGLFMDAVERRYLGKKGVEALLYQRGIDKELINELLSDHTEDMEMETARRLIEKKLKSLKGHPKEIMKRRLVGMLRRRGFSGDVIHKSLLYIKF